MATLRLLVRGPRDYDDWRFVKDTLDKLTENYNDIVLVSDMRPDEETHISPSYFPPAERWAMLHKRIIVRHYAPYQGVKKWKEGQKERRLDMIRDATAMIAFWAVGEDDFETEEMIRLAKLFDLKLKVIKV
jgi:hypothetical protein